ncbi:hypothetical protein VTK73DRAFT_3748 [Phialemonium thermophilum]|uniref:Factor arrest protein 11 n=1 Tax=Phialemonium thermophilum TaxID=223376 RepID=A0ABR3WXA4_9PEZI
MTESGPGGALSQPPDSLSLAQLRRIVTEFPRSEPVAYDYTYSDMGPVEEEIDEWFGYNFWQWVRLTAAQQNFYAEWSTMFEDERHWTDASEEDRRAFMNQLLEGLQAPSPAGRSSCVGALAYVVLGRWMDTIDDPKLPGPGGPQVRSVASQSQLAAIKAGVELLAECGGISTVWDATRQAFEYIWSDDVQELPAGGLQGRQDELTNLMTILYMAVQETLSDPFGLPSVQSQLLALEPGLLQFLFDATTRLRWDEAGILPQTQVLLLFWKSLLLTFGGSKELEEAKRATCETDLEMKDKSIITASPLDYHIFRQEITSKYPAYVPPRPVIPLEAEHTSILPQLPNHPTRNTGANGIIPGPHSSQSGGASILHQPVHIATPAPSPPPSPGIGGKGVKKHNYQTNQNFPFMYPPLDASSSNTGGKGGAALQDLLVGRKWEGSDIPASILEAGELFSQRVRMTRAIRQLWEEREKFLKFERGWDAPDDELIDELDLSSLTLEEKEELGLSKTGLEGSGKSDGIEPTIDIGPHSDIHPRIRERLEAVEFFYRDSLPQLQSLVIVLFRAIAATASNVPAPSANGQPQQQPQQQQTSGAPGQTNARMNGAGRGQDFPNGVAPAPKNDAPSPSDEEIDATRNREIAAKAATGIILLLLKWFKLSHVLKFEYLTQLLLDSNYIPLVLKIIASYDVQQLVESKADRLDQSFFYTCNSRARGVGNPGGGTTFEEDDNSEDDAVPPPIKRRRSPPALPRENGQSGEGSDVVGVERTNPNPPETDDLGYPINPMPEELITDFSRRNFFTLINYLRIVQKICKNKAHRNLLLVNFKSSTILRKLLKVPQPELRLYTLKLFKNQVPYCGRKWRQSNMRVITAVYLHCRPELRDEWLAGSDVDAEVDEALPLEQAVRSLTHWFNVRRYPDKMAPEARAALREEQDFFVRELGKLDISWVELLPEDGAAGGGAEWEGEGGVAAGAGPGSVWG